MTRVGPSAVGGGGGGGGGGGTRYGCDIRSGGGGTDFEGGPSTV